MGRVDVGAQEEQEEQEEQEGQAVAIVTTRPVDKLAERLSPLLCLLSKWCIRSLRRCWHTSRWSRAFSAVITVAP